MIAVAGIYHDDKGFTAMNRIWVHRWGAAGVAFREAGGRAVCRDRVRIDRLRAEGGLSQQARWKTPGESAPKRRWLVRGFDYE